MGLRSAEIAQIRREDITEHGGRMILSGIGKGQKPYTMAVPVQVVPYLAAHLGTARGQLWRAPMGGPLAARHCTKEAGELMRALGMSYTLHCLRHRFGTAMYAQTRDLLITQQAMRHASPQNTRLYVLTNRAETTAAIDRLAKPLRGPGLEAGEGGCVMSTVLAPVPRRVAQLLAQPVDIPAGVPARGAVVGLNLAELHPPLEAAHGDAEESSGLRRRHEGHGADVRAAWRVWLCSWRVWPGSARIETFDARVGKPERHDERTTR